MPTIEKKGKHQVFRMFRKSQRFNHNQRVQIGAGDWVVFAIIAVISFAFFCHIDILITANHSYAYLNGNIWDFYSACYSMKGAYSANYLPICYIVFAIWNIPLKLLGFGPSFWSDWNLVFIYWNKMLPIIVYLVCGVLLQKICIEQFSMDVQKARLVMYAFFTMPIGFFGQFMFCQYDIFTVFFVLLGLRCFFDEENIKNWTGFLLCFGIACSFKYFSILVFIVLLLLKEKRVLMIIKDTVIMLLPSGLMCLLYFMTDRDSFVHSVMEFSVLEYTNVATINIGIASIRLLFLFICLVAAMAYFTECSSKKSLISYSVYYVCGMFFVLFSFMTWHPQWLLHAVPFWIIGIFINKHYRIMLWLELLFGVVFVIFVVNAFINNVDQTLLNNGIYSYLLQYNVDSANTLSDIYIYKDKDILFTLMTAVMCVFFIVNRPQNHMDDFSLPLYDAKALVRTCFLSGTLLFIIPSLLLLPKQLKVAECLWNQGGFVEMSDSDYRTEEVSETEDLFQYATILGDSISKVSVYTISDAENLNEQQLIMKIYDGVTNNEVSSSIIDGEAINRAGYSVFEFDNCDIVSGRQYIISVSAKRGNQIPVKLRYGAGDMTIGKRYKTVQKFYDDDYIVINGEKYSEEQYHFVSVIEGTYEKPHHGIY